jgi:hypothetical protein
MVGMEKFFAQALALDRSFDSEREAKVLRDLTDALETKDADRFAQICAQWDQMTRMEDWLVETALVAKKFAESAGDVAVGGGVDDEDEFA